ALPIWTTNPNSKTYGDADPNPLTTGSGSGFLAGDNVTATYSRAPGETVTGGPYHITATLSPAGVLDNYIINNTGANFTINPRSATVAADAKTKTYGQASPTFTATVTGEVTGGDPVNYTLSTAATQFSNVGAYAITVTLGANPNYNVTSTNGTLIIGKATATVVVASYDLTYDGQPHTGTVVSITGVNGEIGATVGTVDVSNTIHTNAGTYAADYWFFTGTANYNDIGNQTITDHIGKATATVMVALYDLTYDGQPHTATVVSITGVNGETGPTV